MTPLSIGMIGVLAIILISLSMDATRRLLFKGLYLVFLGLAYVCMQVWGRIPAWLTAATRAIGIVAATGAGIISTAATVITWTLVVLALLLVVGVASNNVAILITVVILLGMLTLVLRAPLAIFPFTHDAAEKLAHKAAFLFWIAVLMLFVPMLGTLTLQNLLIVSLCAMILDLVGKFKWFEKILVGSTFAILAVVVAISMIAPLRSEFIEWRFANLTSHALIDTDEQIEELRLKRIRNAELNNPDPELTRLENKKQRQETIAAEYATSSGSIKSPGVSWTLPSLDDPEAMINLIFIIAIVAVLGFLAIFMIGMGIQVINHLRGRHTGTAARTH